MDIPPNTSANMTASPPSPLTTQTSLVETTRRRKRAPRCTKLDDPEIREKIEDLYTVRLKKLEDIVNEINEAHHLNASKYQYRDRLVKWGCRQRLNNKEYKSVHQNILARQTKGKSSRVLLNNAVEVSDKKFQRWASRNISLTEQAMQKAKIMNKDISLQVTPAPPIPDNVILSTPSPRSEICLPSPRSEICLPSPGSEICLPSPRSEICLPSPRSEICLLVTKRRIPPSLLYNLPIYQVSSKLDQFANRYILPTTNENGSVSANTTHSHLPLLRHIIYQLSNHLVSHGWDEATHQLLNRVDDLGLRKPFSDLLSDNSPSILATCERLVPIYYLRGDDEMFLHICTRHPQLQRSLKLYSLLESAISKHYSRQRLGRFQGSNPKDIEEKTAGDIVLDIISDKIAPGSPKEARLLLEACKTHLGDLTGFFQLWDKDKITLEDLDTFIGLFSNSHESVEAAPLNTQSLELLVELLNSGFTLGLYATTLKAILQDNLAVARVLLEHQGFNFDMSEESMCIGTDGKPERIWRFLDKTVFLSIAKHAFYETILEPLNHGNDAQIFGLEDVLIIYIICADIQITEYVMEALNLKYALPIEQLTLMALQLIFTPQSRWPYNFIPFTGFSDISGSFWGFLADNCKNNFVEEIVKKLFQFGFEPSHLSFWHHTIWSEDFKEGFIPKGDHSRFLMELLDLLLDKGLDIDMEIPDEICSKNLNCFFGSQSSRVSLQLAFLFRTPSVFCHLISRGANVELFYASGISNGSHEVPLAFLQAVQNRNIELIKRLWGSRTFQLQIDTVLRSDDSDHAKEFILSSNQDQLISIALRLCRIAVWGATPQPNILGLLELFLDMGFNMYSDSVTLTKAQEREYFFYLKVATQSSDTRLLDIILKLGIIGSNDSLANASRLHRLEGAGVYLLIEVATTGSIDYFRTLVSYGFNINQVDRGGGNIHLCSSPLLVAIMHGNLDLMVYILREGGNIYEPSAIELAIRHRRIDPLSLLLQTDPNCYDVALKTINKPEHSSSYIAEFVRNWKPCEEDRSDMEIPNLAEFTIEWGLPYTVQ